MDLTKKNDELQTGSFKIVDTFTVLVLTAIVIGLYYGCWRVLNDSTTVSGFVTASAFVVLIMAAITARLKAIWNGIHFDLDTRRLSFPGGGLAANGVGDYFNPSFLIQYFKRITVDLDDIQQISKSSDWKKNILSGFVSYKNKLSDGTTKVGVLTLTGDWGTASVVFNSPQKANQAYATLAYYLKLGEPVIVR